MPKVTEAHLEARKQQVLGAAACCFSRKGFHRSTMHDICQEADLSPGAVYRYFGGKEEIIEAMVDERRKQGVALIDAARQMGDTARVLDTLSQIFFTELEDVEGCAVGVELWAEAIRSPRIRELLRDDLRSIRGPFAEIIRAGQARGDISPAADPDAVAEIMVSLFQGLVVQKTLDPDVDVGRYVDAMKAMLTGPFWQGPRPEGVA